MYDLDGSKAMKKTNGDKAFIKMLWEQGGIIEDL